MAYPDAGGFSKVYGQCRFQNREPAQDATENDVAKVYNLAFELGCKGVTIYRDGSKENQVLSFTQKERKKTVLDGSQGTAGNPGRLYHKNYNRYGQLYVTVTEFDGQPFEVFATIGKSGDPPPPKQRPSAAWFPLPCDRGLRSIKSSTR